MILYYYTKYFLYSFIGRALIIFIIYGCFYCGDIILCMTNDEVANIAHGLFPERVAQENAILRSQTNYLLHENERLKNLINELTIDKKILQQECDMLRAENVNDISHLELLRRSYEREFSQKQIIFNLQMQQKQSNDYVQALQSKLSGTQTVATVLARENSDLHTVVVGQQREISTQQSLIEDLRHDLKRQKTK